MFVQNPRPTSIGTQSRNSNFRISALIERLCQRMFIYLFAQNHALKRVMKQRARCIENPKALDRKKEKKETSTDAIMLQS